MDSTTQVITILILVLTMAVTVVTTQFIRRRRNLVALRRVPAYDALPLAIGEAIEANRPVHVSFGSAGLGGASTLLTLATGELFYQVAARAAIGTTPPILTVTDPTAVPLGQDMVRRAYRSRGLLNRYPSGSVRWYPAGQRSLAFAAALTAALGDDRVASNILVGSFGSELALVADAAIRRDQTLIATSVDLEGQAVAYAMSNEPLIGEEVFTAGAYLDSTPSHVGALVAQDLLRLLLILFIFIPTALAVGDAMLQGRFTAALLRLLGRGG